MSSISPPTPRQNLNHGCQKAGYDRNATPLDIRPHVRRHQVDHERHQAEQQIDHRLVGDVGDRPHDREGNDRAKRKPIENRPDDVRAPLDGARAVGHELDDREQDHGGGDVEIVQQHAEQNHAAGHAEHTGDKRAEDDGEPDQGERFEGHCGRNGSN
jgi:hypothetical protein